MPHGKSVRHVCCIRIISSARAAPLFGQGLLAENWQITPIGTSARSRFADALHREGIVWNGRLKRLEPLEIRINRGGKYYYLNDVLEICECRDSSRPSDRKRLECGNYFRERKDAELVCDCVRSIVKLNRGKDVRR